MVNFLYSRADVDRTDTLISLCKSYASAGTPVYMIVPEQLSMQREFIINDMRLNVKVCSFTRLTNEIFRTLGGTAKKTPDSVMIAAAVYRAVQNTFDSLTYYKSVALNAGFVSKLVSVFSEFDINQMSYQALSSIPETETSVSFKRKYADLFIIYNEYKKLWQEEYKAPGDDLTTAAGMLELLPFFENTAVIFDGFYGFTPSQLLLVEQVILKADTTVFSFTTDLESEVFASVTSELEKVKRICDKHSVKTSFEQVLSPLRLLSNTQRMLEKTAFLLDIKAVDNFDLSNLTLYSAKNINEELSFIACKIKNDVLSGKYRYKDIAVLVPPATDLSTVAATVFEKHGVPVFVDSKRTLLSKPLTAFVICALEIAISGFDFENVFSFLKTGLTGIPLDDISMLENYVRLWKLRAPAWTSGEWTKNPSGLVPELSEQDKERLQALNALRERIVTPLVRFKDSLRGNCRDMLFAVCRLLEDFNVPSNLAYVANVFTESGNTQTADEYMRIYDIFIDMLDSIDVVYGTKSIPLRRFYDLITVSAEAFTVSDRPTRIDEVIFAPIGSARADFAKCVYIPNLVSGVYPASLSETSLITEADKRILNKYGIATAMDFASKAQREVFDMYISAFSATTELVLSHSLFEITGEPKRPSQFIEDIKTITSVTPTTATDLPFEHSLVSIAAASELAAGGNYPNLSDIIFEITGLAPILDRKEDTLSDDIVRGMYSKNLRLSFSSIEDYVGCPFKFFLHKGLRIGKNEPVEFNPANIGTFIHSGLERLLSSDIDFDTIDENGIKAKISEISESYYNTELADCKNRGGRFDYLFSRARFALETAAVNVVGEVKASAFTPFDFEINISDYIPPVHLNNGFTLSLAGSIDRVDMANTANGRLAKIIDYKSGSQKFSLQKIYNGISMQLPIYAGAVRAKHGDVRLAAMYYLKVGVPKVDLKNANGITDEQYRSEIDSTYLRDGIFSNADGVIKMLDPEGKYIKKLTADNLVDEQGLNTLVDFTLNKVKSVGEGITGGNIRISPVCYKDFDSCRYCDYKNICNIKSMPERVRELEDLPENFLKKEVE